MAKWIEFRERNAGPGRKTKVWEVVAKDGGVSLGAIGWYSAWRTYALYPEHGTIFEPTCLRDIADFIQEQNRAHKEALSAAKQLASPSAGP
jgi:hypothetical protein